MNTPQLNIQELETLKSSIDTMNRANHVEILKILKENDVKIKVVFTSICLFLRKESLKK
jgi:hypothetical protein